MLHYFLPKSLIRIIISQCYLHFTVLIYLFGGVVIECLGYEESQKVFSQPIDELPKADEQSLMIYDEEKARFVPVSIDYKKAKDYVAHFKAENDIAPNLNDFYHIIFDGKYELTDDERFLLWQDVCNIQQPSITKESLIKIYLAKRESIKDFSTDFIVEKFDISTDGKEQIENVRKWKYAVKDNRMFISEIETKDSEGNVTHRLSALNRSDFRYVVFSESSSDAGIQKKKGTEFESDGLCLEMPLVPSMIFDQTIYHLNRTSEDMPMMLSENWQNLTVMEKTEMFEGNECLIIASLTRKFYLDINKDFSVCYIEFFDKDTYKSKDIQSIHPRSKRILHNLVSYGNGIWLPSEVERFYYDADRNVTSREHIVYNDIRINQGLKDEFFVDVIPDGAFVADSIRNMVYVWGDRASIGSLIKETVKKKRQTIYRNLSLVLGLCFIACWGIVEWRKRRLLKGEVE